MVRTEHVSTLATRSRLGREGFDILLPNDVLPPPNRRKAAIQNIGDLLMVVTLLDQLAAFHTQDLKFRQSNGLRAHGQPVISVATKKKVVYSTIAVAQS
jgi:hypothetical protein